MICIVLFMFTEFPGDIPQIFITINIDILCVGDVMLFMFDGGVEGFIYEFSFVIMFPLGIVDHGHVFLCNIK